MKKGNIIKLTPLNGTFLAFIRYFADILPDNVELAGRYFKYLYSNGTIKI